MSDQVEEVKQKTDIVALIGERVELKKAGSNFKALCPFHGEKTPSFMVSPELQIFKCFGCGESGDAFSFLEKYEGMDFSEALSFLADRAGVKLKPIAGEQKDDKGVLFEINSQAAYFYHYLLTKHPVGKPAFDYLVKKRKLKPDTVNAFRLGFSPNKEGALVRFLVDKKKYKLTDLEKAGLVYLRGSSAVDRLKGRVVFPLMDHRENVVGFAGRVLPWDKRDVAKYINTPETAVYHKSKTLYGLNVTKRAIKEAGEAVVVEGELDAISSWQIGINNIVAIKGSALTEDQVRLLSRFTSKIVLALDADVAGDKAARRGIGIAENQGFEVRVAQLGKFKDPDDAAKEDPEGLRKAVEKAVAVWDFIVASTFSKYDPITGAGKAKISSEIVPQLATIEDKIVQAHYVEVVAKKLDVPTDAVVQQVIRKGGVEPNKPGQVETKPTNKRTRRELLEERLLALAFRNAPQLLLEKKYNSVFATPLAKKLVDAYTTKYTKAAGFSAGDFVKDLPGELVQGFEDLVLKDIPGVTDQVGDEFKKEVAIVINEINELALKEKITVASREIANFEKKKETKKLEKAKKEFGELTKELTKLEANKYKGIIL